MPKGEVHQVFEASVARVLEVISDYEKYPEFLGGCHEIKVDRSKKDRVRATYKVTALGYKVDYTLDHYCDLEAGILSWELVDSTVFKENSGSWKLKDLGKGKTDVIYNLSLEFKVPVPGFMINMAMKKNLLPAVVSDFGERVKNG